MADTPIKTSPATIGATPRKAPVKRPAAVAAPVVPPVAKAAAPAPAKAGAPAATKPVVAPKQAFAPAKPAPVAPRIESAPKPVPAPLPATVETVAKPVEAPIATPAPAAEPAPKTPPTAVEPVAAKPSVTPTPALTITEGSRTMNEAINTIEGTAKTFTADTSGKMQAMLGEATERAKGAYEKSVKLAEEMTEFGKGNVEAIVESSKLAAKGAESLGQEAADYARKSFESSTAAFKTFASAKSPTELFKLQSDYMKSSFDAAIAESSKVTEAWLKLAGEIVQPVSNRLSLAMEKARAVAL